MIKRTFLEYVQHRQGGHAGAGGGAPDEGGEMPITSKISLGDGNNLPPLMVSDDPNSQYYGKNKNLAVLIRAFKKGGNWGWTRDDKNGEDKPVKMGSKKLFMTGGAVRDHLFGKRPRNVELVTNASPDEIYNLLCQNKFQFIGDGDKAQAHPTTTGGPNGDNGGMVFWVKKQDKKGRPYTFGIKIRGDEFELSVFTKMIKEKDGILLEPGTHADDAAGRDFTINAMSLALTQDNGPNKELYDFYGGLHHLMSGRISAVGSLDSKLREDPLRALRYARMLSKYGNAQNIPEEEKNIVRNAAEGLSQSDRQKIMDEFQKGLNAEDGDPRQYLRIYNHLGLLQSIFPGANLDTKLPKELRELGDKHAPVAWMLRNLPPEQIDQLLQSNFWKPEDAKKIMFFIQALQTLDENIDEESLDSLVQSYLQSGLSARKLKMWATKLGGKQEALIDAFLQHAASPRVRVHTSAPGEEPEIDAAFSDLTDPFSGEVKHEEADYRKKRMEWENFRKFLKFNNPTGKAG